MLAETNEISKAQNVGLERIPGITMEELKS